MMPAGLLAYVVPARLPVPGGQWSEVCRSENDIYSYGDSAGIAPDFPFNPCMEEPASGAKVSQGSLSTKRLLIQP